MHVYRESREEGGGKEREREREREREERNSRHLTNPLDVDAVSRVDI